MLQTIETTTLGESKPRHLIVGCDNDDCCPGCGAPYRVGLGRCDYCRSPVRAGESSYLAHDDVGCIAIVRCSSVPSTWPY